MGSLSYRVLDCPDKAPLIHVDDNGHLMSGSLTGTASLQITVQESFGVNQTIILAVKVHPLSYPYIHLNTQIHVNGGGLGVGGGGLGVGGRELGVGGGVGGVDVLVAECVQVVTVSYLRLSTSPVFYTSNLETLSDIPLGSVLTFIVHFHDSTGEALHSHNSQLTFSTNRYTPPIFINQYLQYRCKERERQAE